MKSRILKIVIPILIIIFAAIYGLTHQFAPSTVYAVGDLIVNWGIGIGDVGPIFNISDWAPGDSEERTVNIENSAVSNRAVAIKGEKTTGIGDLEEVLEIIISDGINDLYGGTTGTKTVKDFFDDSSFPLGIFLFNLAPSANQDIDIKVKFMESAGNDYQNANVVFNIIIGVTVEIPAECLELDFDEVIFGTDGNDRLRGGAGSQLIISFEGNDRLDGGADDDCLVGGAGNDRMDGGAGNDVIDGEDGNDRIDGGAGPDIIYGGGGNDNIDGGAGNDVIDGEDGNDNIEGDAGNDDIFGDAGNDNIRGDAGNDNVDGGAGNDTMRGASGDDNLVGGADQDNAHGQTGVDSCNAEVETSCEI